MPLFVVISIFTILIIAFKLNEKRVIKINMKHDQEVKTIIETYYTVDKVECIYRENGKAELVFQDNSLNLNSYQVQIVNKLEDEKIEIKAPLYNERDLNDLFERVLSETYFYISKDRYDGLIQDTA
ncbi:TPA: hypothetical protein P6W76_002595 [Staphylococcus aureus]|uniref:Putative non cytoplasmic protein n=1 Tax=Staphylococcus aureus TaxID=1280 RepID=A0A1W5T8Q8_STAAU|nr:hypothetical protein [Staphylococcus aureus]ARF19420.1 putative non cytoplasmic protein [Staphylococcus aureus]HDH0857948.1 hypothetical protein [Staphylococcus aureus]HDH5694633.1 hypothetical protein [Staphylococcus aureus]HDH5697373.1 hypothetical protein [Staphylococcus aureus]HDP6026621.1 hypothetical protein [Staphylococcus aureus]